MMKMMEMMMVANSLMISDSTGKRYEHSTAGREMLLNLISTCTHRSEQFTGPQAIENDMACKGGEGTIGSGSSHRRQILRFTGRHWCLLCLLRVSTVIHEARMKLPKFKAPGECHRWSNISHSVIRSLATAPWGCRKQPKGLNAQPSAISCPPLRSSASRRLQSYHRSPRA